MKTLSYFNNIYLTAMFFFDIRFFCMKVKYKISWLLCLIIISMASCQKETVKQPATQIALVNPGFEDGLNAWKIETAYTGGAGFTSSKDAVRTGTAGLNFYAAQSFHYAGAPQETPWNGKIYQTVTGLTDGNYTFKIYADAVGTGMFLWANGGEQEVKMPIKSAMKELNTLDFTVKGGTARIGFICIDANGTQTQLYAPYFHADDAELWTK